MARGNPLLVSPSCYLLVIFLVASVRAGGPWCFSCNDASHPAICQFVVQCGDHESCSTQKTRNRNGGEFYTTSCKDTGICQAHVRSASRVTQCDECCTGTLCNEDGCNSKKLRVTGGLFCLKCDFIANPAFCDQVELCSLDEYCSLTFQKLLGQEYYNLGCRAKTSCKPNATIAKDKSTCCDNDLCNSNDLGQNPASYTPPPITTTPKPAPPRVSVDDSALVYNITHASGEKLQLLCHVTGGPPPSVEWTYDNGTAKISLNLGITVEANGDSTLSIPIPEKSDAGNYTCTATNNLGKAEATIRVTVVDPPEIQGSLNESLVLEYQEDITLDCNVTMDNDTKVHWTVPAGVKSYTVHPNNNSLTIHNAHVENTGSYSCVAENADGTTVKTFSVDVNDTSSQASPQPCICPTMTAPTCPVVTQPPCPVVTCPPVKTTQCPKVTATPCPTLPTAPGNQGSSNAPSTTTATSPALTSSHTTPSTSTSTTSTSTSTTTPSTQTPSSTTTTTTTTTTPKPQINTLPTANSQPMSVAFPSSTAFPPTGNKVSDQFQREKRYLNILQCPVKSNVKGGIAWHRLVHDFDHGNPSYVDNGYGVLTISNQVTVLTTGVYECRIGNSPVGQFVIYEELSNNVNCNDAFSSVTSTVGVVIRAKCGNCPQTAPGVAPNLRVKLTDSICKSAIAAHVIQAYGGDVTYFIQSPTDVVLLKENNSGIVVQ